MMYPNEISREDALRATRASSPDATPHCDAEVVHAPGECVFCDVAEEVHGWQTARREGGHAFTGHAPDAMAGQLPCPSDVRRGKAGAHVWGGNAPVAEAKVEGHRPTMMIIDEVTGDSLAQIEEGEKVEMLDGQIVLVFRDCPECGQAIACKPDGDDLTNGCKDHS